VNDALVYMYFLGDKLLVFTKFFFYKSDSSLIFFPQLLLFKLSSLPFFLKLPGYLLVRG
jgi:hypothetical protein